MLPQKYILFCIALFVVAQGFSQAVTRQDLNLNNNWYTIANDSNQHAYDGFEKTAFRAQQWKTVQVPHNWDAYEGYRRLMHGNRHGFAWYRKNFSVPVKEKGKRYFLWFEGVGSYATVWLNGKKAGEHAGGRTTFTIDVTDIIQGNNQPNLLAVRADHPAGIADLPWVCGGCSEERGFSEGSQPMGIFRPVHLIITNDVRVEPFGVHIWNDTTVSEQSATLQVATTIKNYSNVLRKLTITQTLLDKQRKAVIKITAEKNVQPGTSSDIRQQLPAITNPHLWSLQDPYCYTLVTTITENGKQVDAVTTSYGIRWISWPVGKTRSSNQFLLNGKPVFLNGVGEYEHIIGGSHAFSDAAVKARVQQIKAAGFNAFRDAHQPHNLRYQYLLDSVGIVWWTQLSAHVWYDTKEFRTNFKTLLKEWVIERRNSPSLVLWGLQNESKLPDDFARECTELVRQLDPTTSSQRLVTTCNGGEGSDWNVPQNWTGTYGGNPATYAQDVKRQILIGEYGAWRTTDLHTEGPFVQNGPLSEDRMTQLMETKVRLAESVKDSSCGQFFWIYNSHDNPGRVQGGEGLRELDRIGPVNYKGLLTPWEEPLDVFYMYRANYAPKETSPMVYIVSHTWPNRWTSPGKKDGIVVYSNCDEVELFNDVNNFSDPSLGKKTRNGIGTHFQWDGVDIKNNVLYAVGYVKGQIVASDCIVLDGFPPAPHLYTLYEDKQPVKAQTGYNYLYRVNCGGPDYVDKEYNIWLADRAKRTPNTWGSVSWTKQFDGMPPYFASQRRTYDPVTGTSEWALFQTFRYGREQLKYEFPVPDGDYLVELYFIEPWWGTGGGMDCTGWRLFDVAINNKTVLKDLDIWKEAGHDNVLKKTVNVHVTGGTLSISFPRVAAGQALISAIAIATKNKLVKPAGASPLLITQFHAAHQSVKSWLNTGDYPHSDLLTQFIALPPVLYGADWICTKGSDSIIEPFVTSVAADVFIALDVHTPQKPAWMVSYEDTKTSLENGNGDKFAIFRKRFPANTAVTLGLKGNDSLRMYTVMVQPATTLQPAFDLKPTAKYVMAQATMKGDGINKQSINNRESMVFTKASGSSLEFTIDIGVADIYSLTFRYYQPAQKTAKAKWQLLAADGTLMKTEAMEFSYTRPYKWNYFSTTTGSMINAGKYTVRIIAEDAEGVGVGGLDVQ